MTNVAGAMEPGKAFRPEVGRAARCEGGVRSELLECRVGSAEYQLLDRRGVQADGEELVEP
jgi:hypothetical protein